MEASVWTERMLVALVNGVKAGKWYSLIDKVYDPRALQTAWKKMASNELLRGLPRSSSLFNLLHPSAARSNKQ